MHQITLDAPDDFDGWRHAARTLALAGVAPGEVAWRVGDAAGDLFAADAALPAARIAPDALRVSRRFLDLARSVVMHAAPERFALLYAMLIRLSEQPGLIEDRADPALRTLERMAQGVRRDIHKMRAFVRFRQLVDDQGERYVAWFEPEHHIVRHNARFFVDRFNTMRWTILTPEITIDWDTRALREGPGATRGDAPDDDPVEAAWKTYYAATFNPARVKIGAMMKEMPRKYWHNMPETALVKGLIAEARQREHAMIEASPDATTARPADAPGNGDPWSLLRAEADACRRCPLWQPATQMVFGEGPRDARLMLVGEQPGDQEDLAGRPFVGPAGQMLDRALAEAGIERAETYVTNAVKHFKFEPRGKRRIHAKPDAGEIEACRWWIDQEIALVQPRLIVALGASAARSLTGRAVTIGRERGRQIVLASGMAGFITIHPSFLLRIDDRARADAEYAAFVRDLAAARAIAAG
ncbi:MULTISPECIES: UdgX family uracil-DNA binding protein [unclassified Sphingomonas]|uniref:UdgX family uracil-DNA binding protein n=1 Tax=unclassified Sphingomonas TaxID=196159 RepID=UPI00083451A1|nr:MULTISPECIES: UdgX family uracil-DNA binding protein [unclassified Sphingomonas]